MPDRERGGFGVRGRDTDDRAVLHSTDTNLTNFIDFFDLVLVLTFIDFTEFSERLHVVYPNSSAILFQKNKKKQSKQFS
jgi:hypothetical protein